MRASFSFAVYGDTRAELLTAAQERAWEFFGDDQSAVDPPTLTLVRFEIVIAPFAQKRYRGDVVAEGELG